MVGPRWNLLLVGTDERLSMPETPHFTVSGDGRVSGSDGCNRLTGQVRFGEKGRVDFRSLPPPGALVPRPSVMPSVSLMLENAYRYLIDHDRLVFFGPDQRVLGLAACRLAWQVARLGSQWQSRRQARAPA
ncbi:META domain-containing protein [Billgrantia gudaonensis]|uniref:META domain-containing protein n=1 Tax=Billgrantia gudaonensis TaxID=376427 RepID=A0A432JJV1_9GAMM|nr:META domain-containing protein [Halomonas gudaonensis]